MGSRYPEFRITKPHILCFINWTKSIRNIGGLVIRKFEVCRISKTNTNSEQFFCLKDDTAEILTAIVEMFVLKPEKVPDESSEDFERRKN